MAAVPVPILPAVQLKRILFATDFSNASCLALPIVGAISRKYGSQIYVVNVWSPLPISMPTPEALAIMEQKEEEEAKTEMARLIQTPELQELPIKPLIICGDPADEIRHVIEDQQIDLAIIATHGRSGFKRLLMGSLAEKLIHALSCPILSIGPQLDPRFKEWKEIRTILYPTDLSPESRATFPYVASLAAQFKAKIVVLHVVGRKDDDRPDERAEEILRVQMRGLFLPQTDPRCQLDLLIDQGDRVERILETAKGIKADLIGLGVRRAGEFVMIHFRQTVTYGILLSAECPVLTSCGFGRQVFIDPDENKKGTAENEDTSWRKFRREDVGHSGVYPMSGPHPAGDAPLRGQMGWGQGARGASGYEDHGGSGLSLDSNVLVGGLDAQWSGAAASEDRAESKRVRDIPLAEWPAFCEWFTRNFSATETSIEVSRDREERIVETTTVLSRE